MSKSPLVLVIDAEIGGGKSTLLDVLKDNLIIENKTIKYIYEPVEEWKSSGVLEEFYNDIPKNAYKFQTYTFITRVKKCIEAFDDETDIYICERSIFSDKHIFVKMLHHDKHISDLELQMYNEWWSMWEQIMPFKPTAFIYLQTPIDECMKRVMSRNRGNEISIPREYQEKLQQCHIEFMEQLDYPVFKLDGTIDYTKKEGMIHITKDVIDIINNITD